MYHDNDKMTIKESVCYLNGVKLAIKCNYTANNWDKSAKIANLLPSIDTEFTFREQPNPEQKCRSSPQISDLLFENVKTGPVQTCFR